ncbi:MAG: hypothetical protein HC888_04645 [Candidatus Competibacteraceae bacterium]|nr:hypothetical protein [Candidatus Competibacteraceae bacterium]
MAKRRKIELPKGFEDEQDFVRSARKIYAEDYDADHENREAAEEDAEFAVGNQWDSEIKSLRDSDGKPTLTVNLIPSYIGQLVGNRRLNETVIKVIPDHGGTKDVARVREGLIRSIQKNSRASRAYDAAYQNQVIGGIGNFRVVVDYANDDVFEQDIKIAALPDVDAVVWDRRSVDPTGADARHVFITDTISKEEFEERYPDVSLSGFEDATTGDRLSASSWYDGQDIRIAEYWRMSTRKRLLALMTDGDVEDITDEYVDDGEGGQTLPPELMARIQLREDGEPVVREVDRPFAEMYLLSGHAVLEGPYRLPISRVPAFKCVGWEVRVNGKCHRWGLVRFMKDPMRFYNLWRSAIAEKIMRSPKAQWIGPAEAFEGYEQEWRNAHLNNDPLLRYNGDVANAPQRVDPIQVEAALLQAAQMAADDNKLVTNMHEASFGQQSNEVSGKAIVARQRVGELGSIIYLDNLNAAIEECGRVCNELIPTVYDTPRMVKILGEDDAESLVRINDTDQGGPDIAAGKYAITITTGPSTATKRIEAAESMMTFINHAPQAAAVIGDLIAENMDWPGSQKIARRLRATIPPNVVGDEDLTDEQKQAQAAAAQQQQAQAQFQMQMAQADLEYKQAQAQEARARAAEAEARAEKARSEIGVAAAKAEAEIEAKGADADLTEAKTVTEMLSSKENRNGDRTNAPTQSGKSERASRSEGGENGASE